VMAGFAKQLTETRMVPLTPAWVEVDKNKAVLQNMVRKIMQGQASVDEAAAQAAAEMNQILNAT
jgi:N,N'-diacetylchitobiose transport system substrate-binding protein